MYGIKVDRKLHDWYVKPEKNCIWVGEDLENYVEKRKALKFETKALAEKEITEPWEFVAEI